MAIDDELNRSQRKNSFGDAPAAAANPNVVQVPTGGMKAPAPDGSQNNPLNNEIGRNALNTLSALPGVGGLASRAGAGAAQTAGRALSTERTIPAAWDVVQEGGALAKSGDGGVAQLLNAPSQGGQLAQRAATQVGEVVAGLAPRGASATQWADVVPPAALAAPQAAQSAAGAATSATAAPSAGRYAAGAGLGASALLAGSTNPGGTQLPAPGLLAQQPVAAPKPNFFPGNSPDAGADIYARAGFGKSQTAPPAAPAKPDLAAQIPGQSARAPAPDGSQADAWNTDLGRNVRNTAMAIPGAAGVGGVAATGGLISRGISALAQGVRVAGGVTGINAAQDSVGKQQPTAVGSPASTAGAGRGSVNPPLADPNAPRPTVAPPDNPNNITRVGNSYSGGPNISGDITVNGKEPGGGFMASPGQSYPSPGLMSQTATQQLATAPQVQHSGNSFAARKALENAATSASSITNDGSGWDKHRGISPARAAYAAMLKHDLDMQGAQPGVDMAAMKENAATGRAAMQEGGQNSRFGQTQGIALSRLAMEKETKGIANRGASLVESMRAQIAQEPDTTKRQPLVQRLRELQGGQTADPYLVVPGGQGLTSDEKPYTMPSSLFNRQTQQWVQQPAQPSANHLAALRANPGKAADFDVRFGAGAARRAMGG